MANAKISNDSIFVPKTNITDVDGLAGFKGSGNVKISGANLITSLESNMSLSNISGTLSVTKGGTGQTSYVDGELLIGNTTGNTLAKATLTQGTDLSITNGNGSISIGHAAVGNTPGSNSTTLSAGGNFTAINSVTVSAQGHLTAQNTETYTLPSGYSLPLAADGTRGGIQIGATSLGVKEYAVQLSSEKAYVAVPWVNTTYSTFTYDASDPANNSTSGLVPAPTTSGDNAKFLRGDSTWATPTNTTYNVFTGADGSNAGSTGLVPQPTATDDVKFLTGAATWATPTDTGVTGVTLALGTGATSPLAESITSRELTITSNKYGGTSQVGYVPEGGTASTFLRGDGTWVTPTNTQNTTGAADPSATISGTVVNGSATTFMRSDAVPALGSTITIGTGGSARGLVDVQGGSNLDAQLRLNCSAGTHAVVIEGPDHLTGSANYIVKLPHGAPALNKILKVGTYAANTGDYADPSLATMVWADDTDTSIYAANGVLTGDREVTMGAHNLTFKSTTAGQEVEFQKNLKVSGQSFNPLQTISSTSSWTPDWDSGNVQTMELTANTAIANPSNIELGATYIIILKQDSTGSRTVTWGTQYKFPANTPPILTTGANKADVITLVAYSSTVLMCTSVLDFATS